MSSSSSAFPSPTICLGENATECLLRAIYDADSGYNWDPVTFAFTAVFTILSIVVAIIALFQTLIAAGPGRLKASEGAIGPSQHRKRTKTRYSWEEFRFRTIVHVPVLDITNILEHDRPSSIDILGNRDPGREVVLSQDLPQPTSPEHSIVAGWSQLLHDLSLLNVDFRTIECLTDYLPDDVPAAPAWAKVETLLLLCVMKGCTQLSEESGWIVATGPSAQLSWNMHPTLGPIGVYRTWNVGETAMHTIDDVQRMIPTLLGYLYLSGELLFKPFSVRRNDFPVWFNFSVLKQFGEDAWSSCRHKHDHCKSRKRSLWESSLANSSWDEGSDRRSTVLAAALFSDRPARAKAFPAQILNMHSAIRAIYEEYFPWFILSDTIDTEILSVLCGPDSFVQFGQFEATYDIPAGDGIILRSWLVSASHKEDVSVEDRPVLTPPDFSKPFGTKMRPPFFHNKESSSTGTLSDEIQSSKLRISKEAVRHLSKWLADDQYFRSASKHEMMSAKYWLAYQLAEVDWFLSSMDRDAICAATNLVALGCHIFVKTQFTKISRRFVMPETLDAFNLNWQYNPEDEGSILVTGYVDSETIQRLFTYTKAYVEKHRDDLHTVKCTKVTQGFYFASNKPGTKVKQSQTSRSRSSVRATSLSELIDTTRGRTFKAADMVTEQVRDRDRSHSLSIDEHGLRPSIDAGDKLPDIEVSSHHTIDSGGDAGKVGGSVTAAPVTTTETDERRSSVSSIRRSPHDEVHIHVDPKVNALEALTFFRAGIFAAFLASGVDTSLVLTTDKRFQLVQVQ